MCLRPLSGTDILWRKSKGLNKEVKRGARSSVAKAKLTKAADIALPKTGVRDF